MKSKEGWGGEGEIRRVRSTLLGQREIFNCVFQELAIQKNIYVRTDYHISIYDNIPKVAYIFNGAERTKRGKEGRRGSGPLESGFSVRRSH